MHVYACACPRVHVPSCTHKHAHTDQYVILIAFPQQQRFRERASMLRYTYIACLVYSFFLCSRRTGGPEQFLSFYFSRFVEYWIICTSLATGITFALYNLAQAHHSGNLFVLGIPDVCFVQDISQGWHYPALSELLSRSRGRTLELYLCAIIYRTLSKIRKSRWTVCW
jgi:hypothetical protein